MDRLTIPRSENCPAYVPDGDAIYQIDEFGATCWAGEAVDVLAAYEATGLTSEQVAGLQADRDAWKRRAEAAEHDIEILVDRKNTPCDVCERYDNSCHTPASCPDNNYRSFKWRDPGKGAYDER